MEYVMLIVVLALLLAMVCCSIILFYRAIRFFVGRQYGKGLGYLLIALVLGVLILACIPCRNSGRAHEKARRYCCAYDIKQIILFMKMYANDHQEEYTTTYSELVDTNYVRQGDLGIFVCPSSGHRAGALTNIHAWTDYAYVSGLSEGDPLECVLVFDLPENHKGEGANVGFIGGRVLWFSCESSTDPSTGKKNVTFQDLTNNPALFYGTTNETQLAELMKRTKIIYPNKRK